MEVIGLVGFGYVTARKFDLQRRIMGHADTTDVLRDGDLAQIETRLADVELPPSLWADGG